MAEVVKDSTLSPWKRGEEFSARMAWSALFTQTSLILYLEARSAIQRV